MPRATYSSVDQARGASVAGYRTQRTPCSQQRFAKHRFICDVTALLADNPQTVARCLSEPAVLCTLLACHLQVSAELVKQPRWKFDSLIVRLTTPSPTAGPSETLGIKIHDDIFPLAAHMYNSPHLLAAAASTGHAVRVHQASVLEAEIDLKGRHRARRIRIVIYHMIEGENLAHVIEAGTRRPQDLRKMLKVAVDALLSAGIHPLLRDLSDFTLLEEGGGSRLVMTDYNAMIDCTRSGAYSTNGVGNIISPIVDSLIGPQYRRYNGAVNTEQSAAERLGVLGSVPSDTIRRVQCGSAQ